MANIEIDSKTPATIVVEPAPEPEPLINFEATPEFRKQFQKWKEAKLKEVLNYLHNNWDLTEVTIDRLTMMPQFVLPDRKNRNMYGQASPGQTFTDIDGNVVPHPETNQPMVFTVWRKVDSPTVDTPAEQQPEIEPAPLVAV